MSRIFSIQRACLASACSLSIVLVARAQKPTARLAVDLETTAAVTHSLEGNVLAVAGKNFAGIQTSSSGSEPWVFGPWGEKPQILADLVPGQGSSHPRMITEFQGHALFFATTPAAGREVWQSDGTTKNTRVAFEIVAGPMTSQVTQVTSHAGKLYFAANDGKTGYELWSWDGRSTRLVVDLRPGTASSGIAHLTSANGLLWFVADDGRGAGRELFASDGTSAGTRIVQDIWPGAGTSKIEGILQVANRRVVFFARTPNDDVELWTSNGLASGTTQLTTGSTTVGAGLSTGSRTVFRRIIGVNLYEIWSTDGTKAGTFRLATRDYTPERIVGSRAVSRSGAFLWSSDGTIAGTRTLVSGQLFQSGAVGNKNIVWSLVDVLGIDVTTAVATRLMSTTYAIGHGNGVAGRHWFQAPGADAYVTDGTRVGTRAVNFTTNRTTAGSKPTTFLRIGDDVVLRARRATDFKDAFYRIGSQTLAATRLRPVSTRSTGRPTLYAGQLWYGHETAGAGDELTALDVRSLQPRFTLDINPGTGSSIPRNITAAGRRLYFFGFTPVSQALFVTDGSKAGTLSLLAQSGILSGAHITAWGEHAIAEFTSGSQAELWTTDGTTAGTVRIMKDATVRTAAQRPSDFLFAASNGPHFLAPTRIYISDGTVKGTSMLFQIPGTGHRDLISATVLADRYVIGVSDGLYVSDGTRAGTTKLLARSVRQVVRLDPRRAAFSIEAPRGGELWLTDGKTALRVASVPGQIDDLEAHGARWLRMIVGTRIFMSDGTAKGTIDMAIDTAPFYGNRPTFDLVRDRLFFAAVHATAGLEPHVIDNLGATAEILGEGCGRGSRIPRIGSPAPILGTKIEISIDDGPTGAAILALGAYTDNSVAGPGGCRLHVDLMQPILTGAIGLASGKARRSVSIPNIPALRGVQVAWQVLTITGGGNEATPALVWHLGY